MLKFRPEGLFRERLNVDGRRGRRLGGAGVPASAGEPTGAAAVSGQADAKEPDARERSPQ